MEDAGNMADTGKGRVGGKRAVLNQPGASHARENWQDTVLQDMTPQQVALFAAMLVNGGNITRAADTVGMNASYARRLVSQHRVFREAIRQYGEGMRTCLQDWLDLVPQAKATMLALLQDPDGKVRYLAAKDIIDRAEGKPVNKVDLTLRDSRPELSEGEVQLAFSLMKSRGISYPQAVQLIRENPEDAAEWVAAHAVLRQEGETPALPPSAMAHPDDPELPEHETAWDDSGPTTDGREGTDRGDG